MKPLKMLYTFLCVLILGLQAKFSEALRQVKKQQNKVNFWNWGPITVDYNKTCAQNFFQKSLHPLEHTCTSSFTHLEPIIGSVGPSEYCRILDKGV